MFTKPKISLVPDWKNAWKFWSVQLNSAGLLLLGVVEIVREGVAFVPPTLIHYIPHVQIVATAFFVFGLVARLVKQAKDD